MEPETHPPTGDWPADLLRAGEAVARLPRPRPEPGLADRTLRRIHAEPMEAAGAAQSRVIRHGRWWLRQITNPFARVAAMLALVAVLGVFGNLDMAERVGRITEGLIGSHTTDRLEQWADRILTAVGPVHVRPGDAERILGLDPPASTRRLLPRGAGPSAMLGNSQA